MGATPLAVKIICVGKLKESFYIEACGEYRKRLQRYCELEMVELPEIGSSAELEFEKRFEDRLNEKR